MIDPSASVIRDGRRTTLPADDIVPGDVVLLEAGDRVPADLRLIQARSLTLDEAALTGESVPVEKGIAPVAADAPLGDRALAGVLRHLRRQRQRRRCRRRHRHGHRARPDQLAARLGAADAHAVDPPDGPLRASDHLGHARGLGRHPSVRRDAARLLGRRRLHGRGRARGSGDPGRPARRDDHHARHRRPAHGSQACHHPPAARGRDPGLGHHHLLGQDRHADPQRDDRADGGLGRPAVHRPWRRLRAGGCHRAGR